MRLIFHLLLPTLLLLAGKQSIAQSNFHFNIGPEWTYFRSSVWSVLEVENWKTNNAVCLGIGFEKNLSHTFNLGVSTEITSKYYTRQLQTGIAPYDLFVYRFMRLNLSGIYRYRRFGFGIGPTFLFIPKFYEDISARKSKDRQGYTYKEMGASGEIKWNYRNLSFGLRGYWGTSIYFDRFSLDIFKPFRSIGISAGYRIYNERGKR